MVAKHLNSFTVAAIQTCSGMDVDDNLQQLTSIFTALEPDVDLVVLPENFALMGKKRAEQDIAEHIGSGLIQDEISRLAQKHNTWIVAGTIPICSPDADKVYASCLVFNPQGNIVHSYNKRHLFDVDLPNGERYRESDSYVHGAIDQQSYFQSPWGLIGLSVCYDLRFPEHFRNTSEDIILHCVPAAFTAQTGEAHWEVLLKARAIENQCFVVGAAQSGKHENGRETWGHSMVIDSWGNLLNCLPKSEGLCIATIDLKHLQEIRQKMPCLQHKRM